MNPKYLFKLQRWDVQVYNHVDVFTCLGSAVRVDNPQQHGSSPPKSHFRVYPAKMLLDDEDDMVPLVLGDIWYPHFDLHYPTLYVLGYLYDFQGGKLVKRNARGDPVYPENYEEWTQGPARIIAIPLNELDPNHRKKLLADYPVEP